MCAQFLSKMLLAAYGDALSLRRFGDTKSALCTDFERDFVLDLLDRDFDLDLDRDRERERDDFWYSDCVAPALLAVAGINCGRSVTR